MPRSNSGALAKGFQLIPFADATAHMVKKVGCDNTGVAAAFLMLFDSATTPAESSVPDFEKAVAASSSVEIDFNQQGERFSKGLYAVLSSTSATLTTVATAVGWFQTTYQ
jgi:hypothetical protein